MNAQEEHKTLFSRLSEAALVNILRFLAQTQHDFAWHRSLRLDLIADLARASHPLHTTAISVLKNLPRSFPFSGTLRRCAELVLPVFGPGLTSLVLDFHEKGAAREDSLVVKWLILKRLKLGYIPGDFPQRTLLSQQPDLESLCIWGETCVPSVTDAIAEASPGLKHLTLYANNADNTYLCPMLWSIGRTLLSLTLTAPAFDTKKLAVLCPLVTDLCLQTYAPSLENDWDLYCSCGSQLKSINLHGAHITSEGLHRLSAACQNALVDLRFASWELGPTTLTNGPQLALVCLMAGRTSRDDVLAAEFRPRNSESLKISTLGYFEKSFFATPEKSLREVTVCEMHSAARSDEVVSAIATNTRGLRSCFFEGIVNALVLKEIARTNPLLEEVVMNPEFRDEEAPNFADLAEYMIRVLESLEERRNLRSISLRSFFHRSGPRSVAVEDACTRYRFRTISIQFFGVEYGQAHGTSPHAF